VRATANPKELTDLHILCREGRLYDVEGWIQAGRPLQIAEGAPISRRRVTTALEIALENENHAIVLVLLCNGYDPNLEPSCPLDLALRARRWDLLDLLLDWGADPHQVDLEELFGTYNSSLFERFRTLGVDLTSGNALAHARAGRL
jgi:ankyrin repeat protein